jgi:cytochrome c-type biogenesis protein CcmH
MSASPMRLLDLQRWWLAALAALVLSAASPRALGLDAPLTAADPVLEAHLRSLAQELRCLVCQNQTLADSHAALADDLRAQMRAMLRAGASDDEVRSFLTSRYGDVVLYRPPLRATTVALWAGPAALLAAGVLVLGATLRRRTRLPEDCFEPDPEHIAHESIS